MVHGISKTNSGNIIVQDRAPLTKTIKAPKDDVFQNEETRKRVDKALRIVLQPLAPIAYDLTAQEFFRLHAAQEEDAMLAYFEGIAVINGYCTFADNDLSVRKNANRVMKEYLELKRGNKDQEEIDDCKLDYTAGTTSTDTVTPILKADGSKREALLKEHRKRASAHIKTDARFYKQATKFAHRVQKLDLEISAKAIKNIVSDDKIPSAAWVAIKRMTLPK